MDRIDEFITDRVLNGSNAIQKLLMESGYGAEYQRILNGVDFFECGDDFVNDFMDVVRDFLLDCGGDSDKDIWFEGGDEWVFQNGKYCWTHNEFEGWYFYQSPDNQVDGLYRNGEAHRV